MRTLPAALLALVACASEHAAAPQASGARVVAPSASAEASRDVAPAVALAVARSARSREIAYPATRRADTADVLHGVRVPDPYQWLEEEKSPDVQAWMKEQDAFARKFLAPLPGRDAIARRLSELLYVDELGAPRHRGSRYFYSRRLATKEKAIVYVKDGRRGKERLLLDPNSWTKDGSDALGGWWPSWDGKLVAYSVHHNNSDEAVMYLLDVKTQKRATAFTTRGFPSTGAFPLRSGPAGRRSSSIASATIHARTVSSSTSWAIRPRSRTRSCRSTGTGSSGPYFVAGSATTFRSATRGGRMRAGHRWPSATTRSTTSPSSAITST